MTTTNIGINDILGQLNARYDHFEDLIKQSTSEEDSFVYFTEQTKIKQLIIEIENNKEESTKDLKLQNAFLNVQIEYGIAKQKIEKALSNQHLLKTEDINHYNDVMYKYNLFNNILESVI